MRVFLVFLGYLCGGARSFRGLRGMQKSVIVMIALNSIGEFGKILYYV